MGGGGGKVIYFYLFIYLFIYFYGRPNACTVPIKIRSLGYNPHRLCPKLRSLLGYANVSASIVSLKRLIVSITFLHTFNTFEPHDKTNKVVCAPREDSDQSGHPPCLIRVFAVRTKKTWFLRYPLSAQRRLWSESSLDAQSFFFFFFFWFCHEAAYFFLQKLTIQEVLFSSFKLLCSCSFTNVAVTLCITASAKRLSRT